MSNITVRISDALHEELAAFCRQQGRHVSDVVRDSLRRYMAVEKFRALRRKTLPLAEAAGILTDEDVFKAVS